jgi:hypothetical protein
MTPRRWGIGVGLTAILLCVVATAWAQHGETPAPTTAVPVTPAESAPPATTTSKSTAAKTTQKRGSDVSAAVARIKQRLEVEIGPTAGPGSPSEGPAKLVRPAGLPRSTAASKPPRVQLSWRQPLMWPPELLADEPANASAPASGR